MKRLILLALMLVASIGIFRSAPAFGTTLTGKVFSGGSPVNGTVTFQLNVPAQLPGSACGYNDTQIAPQPIAFRLVNGAVASPGVGASPCLPGNDVLNPSNTIYWMTVKNYAAATLLQIPISVTGAAMDIGAALPTNVTTNQVYFNMSQSTGPQGLPGPPGPIGPAGVSTTGLGNSTTVIDVAVITPYTGGMDLYAATQAAIAVCTAAPACTYDYRGYAGKSIPWSQSPTWPAGSHVIGGSMTWQEPDGISIIAPYGTFEGPVTSDTDAHGLLIRKLNTSTDQTPAIIVYNAFSDIHHLAVYTTTTAGAAMPLTSVATSTNTDGVGTTYFLSSVSASITGAIGQTCAVSGFNGAGSGATATFTLKGVNTLQLGQYALMTANGSGYTGTPTTAVLSSGTATCSGTINVWTQRGLTTFTGTTTACATNACAGKLVNIRGFGTQGDIEHAYVYSSTSTTLTTGQSGVASTTPAPAKNKMFTPFASIAGAFGISNLIGQPFAQSKVRDVGLASDGAVGMLNSGCNCNNTIGPVTTGGADNHEGLYIGGTTNANSFQGEFNLGIADQGHDGYANAFGYGVYFSKAFGNNFSGANFDIESVKYSIIIQDSNANLIPSIYYGNSQAGVSGWPGQLSFPIIFGASQGNYIGCSAESVMGINDNTNGYPNRVCGYDDQIYETPNQHQAGSMVKAALSRSIANQPNPICSGTCATSYQYYEVYRDFNSAAAGNCNSGCSLPITLNPVNNAATLDSTHYNYVYTAGNAVPGLACVDILYPDTAHYIAKCVNPSTNFIDDGSYPSLSYTAPTREATADLTTATLLSGGLFGSATNCAAAGSAANPSLVACGAAPSGAFSCATAASTGTCVVSTTAVTAASEIIVIQNASEGTRLSVTCNTGNDLPSSAPLVASKSAGVSFTLNLGTVTTNPACFDYWIIN